MGRCIFALFSILCVLNASAETKIHIKVDKDIISAHEDSLCAVSVVNNICSTYSSAQDVQDDGVIYSFYGSVLSGFAALLVFILSEVFNYYRQKKKYSEERKAVKRLLERAIKSIEGNIDALNNFYIKYQLHSDSNSISTIPYVESFILNRLCRDFSIQTLFLITDGDDTQLICEVLMQLDYIKTLFSKINEELRSIEEMLINGDSQGNEALTRFITSCEEIIKQLKPVYMDIKESCSKFNS